MAKKKRPLARRPRPAQRALETKTHLQPAGGEEAGSDTLEPAESSPEVGAPLDGALDPDLRAVSENTEHEAHELAQLLSEQAPSDEEPQSGQAQLRADWVGEAEAESVDEQAEGRDPEEEPADPADFDEFVYRSDEEDGPIYTGPTLVGDGPGIDETEVEDVEQYLKGLVEAIIFSSDKPQSAKEVARAARLDKGRVQELIDVLIEES